MEKDVFLTIRGSQQSVAVAELGSAIPVVDGTPRPTCAGTLVEDLDGSMLLGALELLGYLRGLYRD